MIEELINVKDLALGLVRSRCLVNIVINASAQMEGTWASAVFLKCLGLSICYQANEIKDI